MKKDKTWIRLHIPKDIHLKHHFEAKRQGETIHNYYVNLLTKIKQNGKDK